jgi:hypothetical protein
MRVAVLNSEETKMANQKRILWLSALWMVGAGSQLLGQQAQPAQSA